MMMRTPLSLIAVALLGTVATAVRAEADPCPSGDPPLDPFLHREAIIARYAKLPEVCLKALFRDCSQAAGESMLDGQSAAVCSMGYEALLQNSFRGDFNALMAWWRSERPRPTP